MPFCAKVFWKTCLITQPWLVMLETSSLKSKVTFLATSFLPTRMSRRQSTASSTWCFHRKTKNPKT
nr:MAG TPA: hypothetical protein [Caudoviricetes sp.]